jgi:hypothetical protein
MTRTGPGHDAKRATVAALPVNRLVRFAMVTFFPRVGALPGVAELAIDEKIAAFRRESTLLMWAGVAGGALLFQLTPVLTLRRPVLASWLSPDDLDAHAHKLSGHRIYLVRQAMFLLKMVGGMFWAGSDPIRASIDLPSYGRDPGTRRVERDVVVAPFRPRVPAPSLVALGRIERERGRVPKPRGHA